MNNFWIAIYSLLNECRNYTFKMNFWLNVEIIHFRWHRKDHKSRKLDQNQQLLENNRISLGFKPSLVLFCKCDNPNIWEKRLNTNANLVSMAQTKCMLGYESCLLANWIFSVENHYKTISVASMADKTRGRMRILSYGDANRYKNHIIYRVFFSSLVPPLKVQSTKKLI